METLVAASVAVLAAFVKESGRAISNELGKKIGGVTFGKARELFQTVRRKFTGGGLEAVEALKKNPDDTDVHAMLRYHIKQCMQSDEIFHRKIVDLLKQDCKKGSDRVFETNVKGTIEHLNQFNQVHGIGVVHAGVFIQNGSKSQPEASSEQGIALLDAGFYDQAIKVLKTVMLKNPNQADPYYYAALSILGGGRPDALQHDKARRIKEYLSKACHLDDRQAHYYYLWAIVQFGFFESKGFDGHPGTSQLLDRALSSPINPGAIRKLLEYLPLMRGNPAYDTMEKSVSC